jgi:hypothetical protein
MDGRGTKWMFINSRRLQCHPIKPQTMIFEILKFPHVFGQILQASFKILQRTPIQSLEIYPQNVKN